MDPICGDSTGEDEYSYNNCMEKCLVRQIMESCNCSLPWFKHTFQCNKNFSHTAEDCKKIARFDYEGYCPFTRHVQCVSGLKSDLLCMGQKLLIIAIMVNQKSKCKCIPSCTALSYNYKIQYEGIHQHDFRKLTNGMGWLSFNFSKKKSKSLKKKFQIFQKKNPNFAKKKIQIFQKKHSKFLITKKLQKWAKISSPKEKQRDRESWSCQLCDLHEWRLRNTSGGEARLSSAVARGWCWWHCWARSWNEHRWGLLQVLMWCMSKEQLTFN